MANTTVNIDIQVESKSLGVLEKELAGINEELKEVQIGSQAFQDLSQRSQEVTKELEKANKAVEGFTADKKFMAADGAIKTMGGSLAGVVGALGLIGVESDAFGEMEKKAASAIAVAIGVKDVSEGVRQLADAQVLAAAKAKIMGITTQQALIATGIGAFVVLLGVMIAYWDDISKAITGLGKKFPLLGKVIDGIKDSFNSFIEAVRPALEWLGILDTAEEARAKNVMKNAEANIEVYDREIELLKARGATAEEVYAAEIKAIENKMAATKDEEELADLVHQKAVRQAQEAKRIADEKIAAMEVAKAARQKEREEAKAAKDKEAEEAAQAEIDRLQSLEDIRKEFEQRALDDAAVTEEAKVLLEQERTLAELDALAATREEKMAINAYYDELIKVAQEEDKLIADEKAAEAKELSDQALIDGLTAEYDAAMEKIAIRSMMVNSIANLAGEETAIGKAALVAQNILRLMELKAVATQALQKIAIDAAGTGADVAKGFASTIKAGFPQNVPLLIAYAAQAAAIIASTVSAFGKAKSVAKKAGGTGGGGSNMTAPSFAGGSGGMAAPASQAAQAPELDIVQPAVRTYVLSGDVSSSQEADARLSRKRTLGG